MVSATDIPRPRLVPKVWLRDSGEEQVATRSPIPASPAKVYGSAPSATPSRVISASPRVISVALVLSPSPMPSAMPTARPITFLTAPPSSQPTTSVLVYGRKYGVWQAVWSRLATTSSVQATTLAAGCRLAISRARLGPLTTATRSGPTLATSAMTSLIRFAVPSSMPFIRLTRTVPGASSGAQAARFSRSVCEGTARNANSAPASASAASVVAVTAPGSVMPGR